MIKVWILVSQTFNFLFYGYNIRWIAYLEFSSIMIFILAGLAEIGGGYFVWQWCGSDDVGSTVVKKSKILFSVLLFKKIIIF